MLNIVAIALFQFTSLTANVASESVALQVPTITVNASTSADGGTGGWGNDIACADGGTGGWGNDVTAVAGGTGGWGNDVS